MRPREVVMHAAQFARILHHSVELLTGRGKDALLDYVREHTGTQSAEYMNTLTALMDLSHDHNDLKSVLGITSAFYRTQKKLFDKWVDLDYIGQKRDKDIFIAQDSPSPRSSAATRPAPEAPPPRPTPRRLGFLRPFPRKSAGTGSSFMRSDRQFTQPTGSFPDWGPKLPTPLPNFNV